MLHILLVEDNPADSDMLEIALGRTEVPVKVTLLTDGAEALAYLCGHDPRQFDLILLDLNLPRLSGIEVLERIRGTEKLRGLPVVVMSGSTDAADVERCYRAGANSYICKHTRLSEILTSAAHFAAYWWHCVVLPAREGATPQPCA
jgi:CheY-like chemotaxis protein